MVWRACCWSEGPITAAAVAETLGLSPAAVRRHLDVLVVDGEAEYPRRPPARPAGSRPAGQALAADRDRPGPLRSRLRRPGHRGHPVRRGGRRRRRGACLRGTPGGHAGRPAPRRGDRPGRGHGPGQGPRDRPHEGGLRCVDTARRDRGAALPAPLPGGPRRRGVPPAVRGRDGGVRRPARYPRPAPGHHRPRRRRVHHSRTARRHQCRAGRDRVDPERPEQTAPTTTEGTPS